MCKQRTNEFVPCRNCPNIVKGGPSKGYYYDEINGFQVIKECSCHKTWRKEQELSTKLIQSNINPDYTLDSYVGTKSLRDLSALKTVADNPDKFLYKTMIYLYGPNGCQKSSMVQALGKELILKDYTVMYISFKDLVHAIKVGTDSFEDPAKEEKDYILKKCNDCDFLIVDEAFDKDKYKVSASGYEIPYIDNFLRTRFEISKKSIIFVSNKKQESIESEGFGVSLQSFVVRNTQSSTLIFLDNWEVNKNNIDRLGLFKGTYNG